MKNYLDGGEAILESFRKLGIDYIMASPGSEWGALWEAITRQKVNDTPGPIYLSCAHETLAVDLAIGYTQVTGRTQAVMLHTGVGILQGSVGIEAAWRMGLPMLVVSGESNSFGEDPSFDPGGQWYSSLSTAGGTHRLAEPLVKWSNQVSSIHTLHEQLIRAGEMTQRSPVGPVYMTVPIETMLSEWSPPAIERAVPAATAPEAPDADIGRVARLIADAKLPLLLLESAGRNPGVYEALVDLAEAAGIAVVDAPSADHANFPKDHELYQGQGRPAIVDEADVVVTVRARAPWYPPRNRPARATIVNIDETPFRPHMVHQNLQADHFLEGDTLSSIRRLTATLKKKGAKASAVESRRKRLAKSHKELVAARQAEVAKARDKKTIDPVALFATMGETLPADTVYVEETITHHGALVAHLPYRGPHSYFRVLGGLGQGLGVALGTKLAMKDRLVVSVIGDGSFMYNPVVQSLALSSQERIPVLIVIVNNHRYAAMGKEHAAYYPDGLSVEHDYFVGREITEIDYAELGAPTGAWGKRVEDPALLADALTEAQGVVEAGRTAILNVCVDR